MPQQNIPIWYKVRSGPVKHGESRVGRHLQRFEVILDLENLLWALDQVVTACSLLAKSNLLTAYLLITFKDTISM